MYLKQFIINKLLSGWHSVLQDAHVDLHLQVCQRENLGDYQINQCLSLAHQKKQDPIELAKLCQQQWLLSSFDFISEIEVAGRGFLNFRLSDLWLFQQLQSLNNDDVGIVSSNVKKRIIVEYSSPNVAKAMHVGHLRTTIIGDSLARLYQALGYEVIRQNHLGDWGTPFGLLLAMWETEKNLCIDDWRLEDLELLYRRAKTRAEEDLLFAEQARKQVVALQQGDLTARRKWNHLRDQSINHIQAIYQQLGVLLQPSDIRSESSYHHMLAKLVKLLLDMGVAEKNQGAVCIFLPECSVENGEIVPLIIQKKDGAFLYATTDLAAVKYRLQSLQADRILYVVDARQTLHFKQIFATARKCGWVPDSVQLEHVGFGTMNGEDGKPFKTRSGHIFPLEDLLHEAEIRALAIMQEKQPSWPADEKQQAAKKLAIAAIKYADLSRNRHTDYQFSLDQMLSFQGNTAPYLLYAYTRIQSLLRNRTNKDNNQLVDILDLKSIERTLVLDLLRYPDCLLQAANQNFPHLICQYLYGLSQLFAQFYEQCSLEQSVASVQNRRYLLVEKTGHILAHGLNLLGIETMEKM